MARYSAERKTKEYFKEYGFLSFSRNPLTSMRNSY